MTDQLIMKDRFVPKDARRQLFCLLENFYVRDAELIKLLLELIFIMPSIQTSRELFDFTKLTCRCLSSCLHLEQALDTVFDEIKLDTNLLEETFTL